MTGPISVPRFSLRATRIFSRSVDPSVSSIKGVLTPQLEIRNAVFDSLGLRASKLGLTNKKEGGLNVLNEVGKGYDMDWQVKVLGMRETVTAGSPLNLVYSISLGLVDGKYYSFNPVPERGWKTADEEAENRFLDGLGLELMEKLEEKLPGSDFSVSVSPPSLSWIRCSAWEYRGRLVDVAICIPTSSQLEGDLAAGGPGITYTVTGLQKLTRQVGGK